MRGVKKTKNQFIDEACGIHKRKYSYIKFMYISTHSKGIIICPVHGEFLQTPHAHIKKKQGCPNCHFDTKRKKVDAFINEVHNIYGHLYDYTKFVYVNAHSKGIIICPIHGQFEKAPAEHLRGDGCPHCIYKNAGIVCNFLNKNNINYVREYKLPLGEKGYRADFYLPKYNLIIEYNGHQHYGPVRFSPKMSDEKVNFNYERQKLRDEKVRKYCNDEGINLIEIDGRKYYGKKLTKYLKENLIIAIRGSQLK